jgi:hypothetical protein
MVTTRSGGTRRPAAQTPFVRLFLLLFAILVVVSIIVDLRRISARKRAAQDINNLVIDAATASETYRDPAGRFTLHVPSGWRLVRNPQLAPWELFMDGPNAVSLRMQVAKVEYATLDKLRERLIEIEREWEIDSAMENVVFQDLPAIQRTVRVSGNRLRMLDLVAGGHEFHLQVAAPVESFESQLPVIEEVLNGFQPLINAN